MREQFAKGQPLFLLFGELGKILSEWGKGETTDEKDEKMTRFIADTTKTAHELLLPVSSYDYIYSVLEEIDETLCESREEAKNILKSFYIFMKNNAPVQKATYADYLKCMEEIKTAKGQCKNKFAISLTEAFERDVKARFAGRFGCVFAA